MDAQTDPQKANTFSQQRSSLSKNSDLGFELHIALKDDSPVRAEVLDYLDRASELVQVTKLNEKSSELLEIVTALNDAVRLIFNTLDGRRR